jgi:hypothetical protein
MAAQGSSSSEARMSHSMERDRRADPPGLDRLTNYASGSYLHGDALARRQAKKETYD